MSPAKWVSRILWRQCLSPSNKRRDDGKEDVKIYIRLKDLISLINKYVTLHDENGKSAMVEISLTEAAHSQTPGKDLLCLGNIYQICGINTLYW